MHDGAPPERSPLLTRAHSHSAAQLLHQQRQKRRRLAAVAVVGAVLALVAFTKWIYTPVAPTAVATTSTPTERLCGSTDDEAGYIQLPNKRDTHYFYWFFQAQHDPHTAPLAIWLTGGPGGSSFIGLLKENGPCRVDPDTLETQTNPYGWHHCANMLWLDQPTNVGFSFGPEDELVVNSTGVAENVYWFLQGFLEKHPELEGREFYITGESFAGNYIPVIAHYIHQQNTLELSGQKHINLRGVAIGNGWTEALTQIEHAIDPVLNNAYNLTLLSPNETLQLQRDIDECLVAVPEACLPTPAANRTLCEQVDGMCYEKIFASVETHSKRNRFDFRQICPDGIEDVGFCGGIPEVEAFLNQPHVRAYLHVDDTRVGKWEAASNAVASAIVGNGDDAVSVAPLVGELLDAGIRVLIYVGDADFTCNWQGNLAWLQALAWRGQSAFNATVERPFLSRDPLQTPGDAILVNAGAVRAFENLVFLKVFNAGHMVPTHQPAVALDLIDRFFANASFLA